MSLTFVPTSELEAVNSMLEIIGERPVNSLEGSLLTAASVAQTLLHKVSRRTQESGLHCNSEYNVPLAPDIDGNVLVPSDALKVDASDPSLNVVFRGGKLYNLSTRSFTFVQPVKCSVVFFLPFEDLPQAVREYVSIVAGRMFQARFLGSDTLHVLTERDETLARASMDAAEIANQGATMFDNYDVARIIDRRNNPIRK